MKINLSYKSDKEFESVNEAGNVLPIDMLPMGEKNAFSPTELLLAGVVACAAVDIVSMIKKRRKTFIDLNAETTGVRKEEHPRGFTEINLKYIIMSPDLTEEELDRIIELAVTKYCSVAESLDKKIQLTHSFEIKRA
jgi:putative redox protein